MNRHRLNLMVAEPPSRIIVLRALPGLGDMLCAVPALRALRAAFPDSRITLLGLRWARRFVSRFHRYLDEFLELPGFPGLTPALNMAHVPGFLLRAQQRRFDLAVQLHGSGVTSNPLIALLGARAACGFYLPGQYCPDPRSFLAYPRGESEVWRNLRLVEFLGIPLQGDQMEFPVRDEDRAELRDVEPSRSLNAGEYVCVHPGARAPARRWPPQKFAAVATALARRGYRIVLSGSEEEAQLAAEVGRLMEAPYLNLARRMSVGALAALIAGARLLISNDTGVSHLAAALRVPSVIVFTAADPVRWAPLDRDRHRVVSAPVPCRPCDYYECPIGHPCAVRVSSDAVLAQADELLQKEYHHAAA